MDNKKLQFIHDLRRLLYMVSIAEIYSVWLRKSSLCPSGLKQRCINLENATKNLKFDIFLNTTPENAAFMRNDLSKDQINDLANLIDLVSDVENISDIVDAVKTVKTQAT